MRHYCNKIRIRKPSTPRIRVRGPPERCACVRVRRASGAVPDRRDPTYLHPIHSVHNTLLLLSDNAASTSRRTKNLYFSGTNTRMKCNSLQSRLYSLSLGTKCVNILASVVRSVCWHITRRQKQRPARPGVTCP